MTQPGHFETLAKGPLRFQTLALGILCIVGGAFLLWNCIRTPTILGSLTGSVLLVGGVWCVAAYVRRRPCVQVHDEGLVLIGDLGTKRGPGRLSVSWSEIEEVGEGRSDLMRIPKLYLSGDRAVSVTAISAFRKHPRGGSDDPVGSFIDVVRRRIPDGARP